ncbi:MAG: tetratricopeptide repeat protein [Polynucleobacter sp.]|jgi:regulator of sirC expression with transglutaminase-like and TPR domain|uniref:SirB1 family protein n=1 Tax=unclassified Polynucleobacter TaxID=2640945 RepID=UPI001B571162|nr:MULTISPECIES: tetratricopeptide repeat protein [unclassified Polynucleobacter]MBP7943443.1 tetratricopeptide repeat protein [Polynucleobacter sp.]MBU3587556.1 tetratricopeptide repeat protein [Polynucleobacter sp. 31A-FELB]MBU3592126.1 tetratricopeptide repeat protein [Polynucleobacter sp. 78F-HAINBA]
MPTQQLDYFTSLVAEDEHFPLTEATVAVAQHAYPDLDVQGVLDQIDQWGNKLKQRITPDTPPIQRLQLLKHFFYNELGFGPNPNDFYAPENSYLHQIIENRRGIPISLAILMMELGQQIGLNIRGVSFPNHFMMRISLQQGEIIMDPLNGDSLSKNQLQEMLDPYLDAKGYRGDLSLPLNIFLRASSSREILSRFMRNLKMIYSEDERWERLLGIQERLVILLPDSTEEVRDRGLIFAQLEYVRPAIADLHRYLSEMPGAEDAADIREHIATLESQTKLH